MHLMDPPCRKTRSANFLRGRYNVRTKKVKLDHSCPHGCDARTRQSSFSVSQLGITAPVYRLPYEVLQEVFICSLPLENYIRPSTLRAPLVLAHVSPQWRRIAFATSQLWNSFSCYITESNARSHLSILEFWLQHAKEISLFVYMSTDSLDITSLFLKIFDSHTSLFRNLRLVIPHATHSSLLSSLSAGLPLLRTLDIRFHDNLPAETSTLHLSSHSMPLLRDFAIQFPSSIALRASSSTLLNISINYPLSATRCLRIMTGCPALQTARFGCIIDSPTTSIEPMQRGLLPHSDLHTLHMGTPGACLSDVIEELCLPSLRHLSVCNTRPEAGGTVWSQKAFNNLMTRSECSIKTLTFTNVLNSEADLANCLFNTSHSLTELRLVESRGIAVFTDSVLRMLTPRNGECICPGLEIIRFGQTLASTDGVLADMAEARWKVEANVGQGKTFTRLKAINPRFEHSQHPDDIRRLIMLHRAGLQIY